jgi:hypothetical protein
MLVVKRWNAPDETLRQLLSQRNCHGQCTFTFISTDMPGSKSTCRRGSTPALRSIEIFTGTRWVTFVKLPEALFGGINENCEAVFAPI